MANTRRTQGEGTVFMRKDGRAMAQAMYEGKRITKYGKTKTEAKQKLDAYLADLRSGKVVVGPKQTIKEYLEHWLENEHRLQIELTSLDRYRVALRVQVYPALGNIQLSQLTRARVQAFYADLFDGGLAPATIKLVHALLSAAFKSAVLQEVIARNPCEHVILPRLEEPVTRALSQEEAARLLAAAQDRRLRFLILMAVTTGARLGELLALRWADIDEKEGIVRVGRSVARVPGLGRIEKSPKTRAGRRTIRLPQVVLKHLDEQRSCIDRLRVSAGSRWQENDLVFPSRVGGHLERNNVERSFRKLIKTVDLSGMRFHDLRHSAATLLLAAGANIKVVQEMPGHSNIQTTLQKYGHVLPDMQKGASDKMDDLFGGDEN
ncbi:MAG TPA: tyrosine-type recombinase/integrase [Ktedonobacteraceae bacterium]